MNIEEVIISVIGGSYIKTDSKGKFIIVIRKKELRVGSHVVMPLVEINILKLNDKNQYVFNNKFFFDKGSIDPIELKIFIEEWKRNIEKKRRKAKFADEPRANKETMLSLNFLGKLRSDFIRWYRNREAYLKKVEAILNED